MKTITKIRIITSLFVASMVTTLTYAYFTNPSVSDVVEVAQGTADSATYEKLKPQGEITGYTIYECGGQIIKIEYVYAEN